MASVNYRLPKNGGICVTEPRFERAHEALTRDDAGRVASRADRALSKVLICPVFLQKSCGFHSEKKAPFANQDEFKQNAAYHHSLESQQLRELNLC